MGEIAQVQLQLHPNAIFEVPLHIYEQNFTFIVNQEEYKTNRIISDLLSPKICQQHLNDPTFDTFIINTHHKGQFSSILDLAKFNPQTPPESELPFISEVLEIFENETIEITLPTNNIEITLDNVFELLHQHEKSGNFYSKQMTKEIEYISSHFFELTETQEDKISRFEITTIERIIENCQLRLKDENQLLNFVNRLYSIDRKYFNFYEFICFSNVDENKISEFIDIFDINDITTEIWTNISYRLKEKVLKNEIENSTSSSFEQNRYKKRKKTFLMKNNSNEFDGIINHLRHESNGNIQNLIDIKASSLYSSRFSPYNACLFEDQNKYFHSNNEQNSWICFDFKQHRIIPTSYIIKSIPYSKNSNHPKSWVIEASNDNLNWETLDEVNDCTYLNGECLIHTFNINRQISNDFRFVRIRQISNNCYARAKQYFFTLGSIEFYGTLN